MTVADVSVTRVGLVMVGKKECEYNSGAEGCGVASFTAAALDTLAGVSSAAPPPVMDTLTESVESVRARAAAPDDA
ncbi:hypothetical protein Pcinc_008816 [Petrolisthes cinctipes]|uniref:Uncharacterized protein n=1 Tax=Petrolisthes cinctipes TaxID=88211 RepID=A0AAE1G824_PETCI|nr:hypothetical protein Pcinc_008816 [Petrolisthes cinctipes]